MNILFLTYEITGKGGNYIRCFSLAKNLVKLGHQVTILTASSHISFTSTVSYEHGVRIIESADLFPEVIRNDGISPIDILSRLGHILTNRYDLVHAFGHRPTVSLVALFARQFRHLPYIADWCDLWGRGGIYEERKTFASKALGLLDIVTEELVYKQAEYLTVISKYLKNRVLQFQKKSHILQIPIGANTDTIRVLSQSLQRKKHHLPLKRPTILYVGITPYDAMFLAQALELLIAKQPDALLLFLGPEIPEFQSRIEEHGLQTSVIHKGFVPYQHLPELLACADICWLPYTNRVINKARYPNKLGDYLAAGKPVVTNHTGDLAQIFSTYDIGFAVGDSPKEFAQKTLTILRQKTKEKSRAKKARWVAENKLSWFSHAEKLAQFYAYVLRSKKYRLHK